MGTAPPQWLIVVSQERRHIHARLRHSFAAGPVEVILDRRQRERRRASVRVYTDRRGADRRGLPTLRDRPLDNGYRLIQQADGYQVYQAEGRVPARCPVCANALRFEMPRFVEPPARLDIEVIHSDRASSAQHFVEIQAFRASGRSLLACRVMAKR